LAWLGLAWLGLAWLGFKSISGNVTETLTIMVVVSPVYCVAFVIRRLIQIYIDFL